MHGPYPPLFHTPYCYTFEASLGRKSGLGREAPEPPQEVPVCGIATGANPWWTGRGDRAPAREAAYVARASARSYPDGLVARLPPAPSAVGGNSVPPWTDGQGSICRLPAGARRFPPTKSTGSHPWLSRKPGPSARAPEIVPEQWRDVQIRPIGHRELMREALEPLFDDPWDYAIGVDPAHPSPIGLIAGDRRHWTHEVRIRGKLSLRTHLDAVSSVTARTNDSRIRGFLRHCRSVGVHVEAFGAPRDHEFEALKRRCIAYLRRSLLD